MKLIKIKHGKSGFSHFDFIAFILVIFTCFSIGAYVFKHEAKGLAASNLSALPSVMHTSYEFKHTVPTSNMIAKAKSVTNKSTSGGAGSCEYGVCYYWTGLWADSQNAQGATISIMQSDPKLNSKDSHTLAEIAVEANTPELNDVEFGWTVDRSINGDSLPHLFVYHWVGGQTTCYNGCGFIPLSSIYKAGKAIKPGVKGTFTIQYVKSTLPRLGRKGIQFYIYEWLLSYDGVKLGYFPESIWNGNFTTTKI